MRQNRENRNKIIIKMLEGTTNRRTYFNKNDFGRARIWPIAHRSYIVTSVRLEGRHICVIISKIIII